MTRIITDKFSARKDLSKQQRYQLRKQAKGLCRICGQKAVPLPSDPDRSSHYCERHFAMLGVYRERAKPVRDAREDV